MEESALNMQVGGTHYVNKGIQPVEVWVDWQMDGFSASILKYITRWPDKSPERALEELGKARHFAELRIELVGDSWYYDYERVTISMGQYIQANKIPRDEDALFYAFEAWYMDASSKSDKMGALFIKTLDNFIAELTTTNRRTRNPF